MINQLLFDFSTWLESHPSSESIHSSFYLWNWIESTHVLMLMVSLGSLFIIDLRMIGVGFTNIRASSVADRLAKPMFIGFAFMIVTGLILYYANAVHETQTIWFRIKIVLLFAAAINAWLFHRALSNSVDSWDSDPTPPKRIRVGAGISLGLWIVIVIMGRLMAYDWFDCTNPQGPFMTWLVGCDLH
ncbi:hypothetical protein NBRC116494_05110 [Aurantivibrio plasticivorans]